MCKYFSTHYNSSTLKHIHYAEGLVLIFIFSFTQSSLYAASKVTYEAQKQNEIELASLESEDFILEEVGRDEILYSKPKEILENIEETEPLIFEDTKPELKEKNNQRNAIREVPFYSQFTDITPVNWRKVGCGIASVAMIIDYYSEEEVLVDSLLNQGIAAGAFLDSAGWTHQGLINLTKPFGLNGESRSMASLSMQDAFSELKEVLKDGPVMVSVHYTFDPQNPFPHLVVVNAVSDGKVFYNDPAETSGGGSITIEKFQSAWKKRYIEILPV